MIDKQFRQLAEAAKGCAASPPVALIVDSPWLPGFAGISAMEYFAEPEKWLKANIKAIERFPDVILVPGFWVEYGMAIEPSAFGAKVSWWSDSPPSVSHVLRDISEVGLLSLPLPKNDGLMPLVLHLQRWAQKEIAPLGYSIRIVAARGPMALATHLRGITEFLTDIKVEPENSHKLLDICTETVIRWLRAQAENLPDVQGILVLDDIVGMISPVDYEEFAHPYLERIFAAFPDMLKIYHNDANVQPFIERLSETGFDILNWSHHIDVQEMVERTGGRIGLMGNVPPLQILTNGTQEQVLESARLCMANCNGQLILSAGGGTSPGTPVENIDALILAASQERHRRLGK